MGENLSVESSIEDKVGQLFFIGIPGPELDKDTVGLLKTVRPGGVCLFARNIKSAEQTRSLLDGIKDASAIEPFLSLDQEGGRVDRLRRVLTPMPAPSQLRSAEDAGELGHLIGKAISIIGFNMDFAPVVDVIDRHREGLLNGLQTRGFGSTKEVVVEMARAFLDSLSANGILGCLKHFPGLAAARVDSHEELPMVPVDSEEFRSKDLYTYRGLLGRSEICVMVAHATYPNVGLREAEPGGKLLPSSLDERIVTSLLREELGFDGVAITDDMEMGAIVRSYGIAEASVMAIKAGEDMLAICADADSIYAGHRAVTEAVRSGEISADRLDRSIRRIAELKSKLATPLPFDSGQLAEVDRKIKDLNQRLN
jgi:beta-N-acetylhexosaminidase